MTVEHQLLMIAQHDDHFMLENWPQLSIIFLTVVTGGYPQWILMLNYFKNEAYQPTDSPIISNNSVFGHQPIHNILVILEPFNSFLVGKTNGLFLKLVIHGLDISIQMDDFIFVFKTNHWITWHHLQRVPRTLEPRRLRHSESAGGCAKGCEG